MVTRENDLDRLAGALGVLTAAVEANTVATERQNEQTAALIALLERQVAADEAMAALGQSLMPGAETGIDVDALEWRDDGAGGFTVIDRTLWQEAGVGSITYARRPATEAESAAIRARYPSVAKRRRV